MGGRYTLQGVVASASGPGVALIAVEGQRALPYRVGSLVDGRWWVQSVGRRTVTLVPVSAGQALAPDETSAGGITLALPVQPSVSLGIQAAGS